MASEISRVTIHADNTDQECGNHPRWRGDGNTELSSCPFQEASLKDLDGMTEINTRLERMLDKAPSDSTANLIVRREGDGYRVFLKLRSAQTKFRGFIRGQGLIEAVERAISEVRSQIDDWKKTRAVGL